MTITESRTVDAPEDTTVFSNPWVTIDTVPAYRGDGTRFEHHRLTSGTGLGAVTIPVVNVRGITYLGLVSQRRPVVDTDSLEFPRGGTVDLGVDEAVRELTEETGLVPAQGSVDHLGELHPDTGIASTRVAVYLARFSSRAFDITDGRVEYESGASVQWVQSGQFIGLVAGGRLRCGMTIAAWGLAEARGALRLPGLR